MVSSYRELKVWRKARKLVVAMYRLTAEFPQAEKYGLASQLQRAAVSIPSNIAEGSSRRSTKEFIRYLNIAYGSLAEAETQLYIAHDLGYVTTEKLNEYLEITAELGRMLNALLNKLSEKTELRTLNSELSNA